MAEFRESLYEYDNGEYYYKFALLKFLLKIIPPVPGTTVPVNVGL
jgi:hypothetical protein